MFILLDLYLGRLTYNARNKIESTYGGKHEKVFIPWFKCSLPVKKILSDENYLSIHMVFKIS